MTKLVLITMHIAIFKNKELLLFTLRHSLTNRLVNTFELILPSITHLYIGRRYVPKNKINKSLMRLQ